MLKRVEQRQQPRQVHPGDDAVAAVKAVQQVRAACAAGRRVVLVVLAGRPRRLARFEAIVVVIGDLEPAVVGGEQTPVRLPRGASCHWPRGQ
ncbi:hypothetical protein [Amycolatopsis magusensis]|uniref:hypothetical protein n=1 Tax=Amycolatopsis magusensis TaxID=882444 RepID=UPI0037A3F164